MTPPVQRAAQGGRATRRRTRRRIDVSPPGDGRMRYLRGSAVGVRVAGAVWGGIMGAACLFGLLQADPASAPWFVLLAPLFVVARPWGLGIWLTEDGFVIKSWFRSYRIKSSEVTAIDIAGVDSAMFGVGARFIIFIGAIGMVQVEFKDKWLPRGYPATVGRRNRVLRLARRLREHTGARLGGDLTA